MQRVRFTRGDGRRPQLKVERLKARAMLSGSRPATEPVSATPRHDATVQPGSRNPAIFTSLMGTLQSRATSGPLAGLASGKLGGNAFVARISTLVSNFDRNAARFLKPIAPRLIPLIDLQGSALTATENQWNQRRLAGLYGTTATAVYFYVKDATTTIRQLTLSRPLWPMGTPNLSLYQRADTLAHSLQLDVVTPLQGQNPPSPATARAVGLAEAPRLPG